MGLAKEVIGQRQRHWSKKKICQVLEVCKVSIYWKLSKKKEGQMRVGYKKSEDDQVLKEVERVLKEKKSYGYKRVTALVNRMRVAKGLLKWNRKRIYRVMKINGLLFLKPQVRRKKGEHTGQIITASSNVRWCSDCFEIHCFNGEKVYVSFILDCHDRQCIASTGQYRPLLKRDVQEMMIKAIDDRFNTNKVPRQIEFLTDRGSIYRAKETVYLARYLGLKSCFTAPHSPQSNGMAEAFVRTIKRDYVYTSDCDCAGNVLKMLKEWIYDYNHNAPHSGLGMKSPVEYKKLAGSGV